MKKWTSIALTAALLVTPVTAFAKTPNSQVIDYVSLGDSLAAGMPSSVSPEFTTDTTKWKGYAYYLDKSLDKEHKSNLIKDGVAGYTSLQLLNQVKEDTKVQENIKKAELITLNIGANDLLQLLGAEFKKQNGDKDIKFKDAYVGGLLGKVLADPEFPKKLEDTLKNISSNYNETIKTIKGLNPTVQVYVMEYYFPFPDMLELPQWKSQKDALVKTVGDLNVILKKATNKKDIIFVETAKEVAKAIANSNLKNPGDNKIILSGDIHLRDKGYQVVGSQFYKSILKNDKIAPAAPSVSAVKSGTTKISGKTDKGVTVYVYVNGKYVAKTTASSTGTYSVKLKAKTKKGQSVKVISKDAAGNKSKAKNIKVK